MSENEWIPVPDPPLGKVRDLNQEAIIKELKELQYKILEKRVERKELTRKVNEHYAIGCYLSGFEGNEEIKAYHKKQTEEFGEKQLEVSNEVDDLETDLLNLNREAIKIGVKCDYVSDPGWTYIWSER